MNLLAIDTSTETASVALFNGKELLHLTQENQKTHARFILPMIDQLFVDAGMSLSQLNAIIFGCGPGSFTGLRIACSIAKALAYAHDLGLIPVSSLSAIAWSARQQNPESTLPVLAVLDARMQEMYWAYYDAGSFSAVEQVSPVKQIILPKMQPLMLAGVGINEYWGDFPEIVKEQIVHQSTVYPSSAAMIGLVQGVGMKPIAVELAQPVYVRNQVTYDKSSK